MSKKSLTEMRGLAQSMGVKWTFSDNVNSLEQKIKLRQTEIMPQPVPIPVPIPEDQRLRTLPPAKVSDEQMIRTMLQPYVERGLSLTFSNGQFQMAYGKKTDSGTMRQPPRVIINCARKVME